MFFTGYFCSCINILFRVFFIQVDAVAYGHILSYVFFRNRYKFKRKVYFKSKLGVTFTAELKKRTLTKWFVR